MKRIYFLIVILLWIPALACGGSRPETQTKNEPAVTTNAPAQPEATATPAPTSTPEAMSPIELSEETKSTYLMLQTLEIGSGVLTGLGQKLEAGEIEKDEARAQAMATGLFFNTMFEKMEEPSPDPAFESIWVEARGTTNQIKDILGRWINKQAEDTEFIEGMNTVAKKSQAVMDQSVELMVNTYHVPEDELKQFRSQAEAVVEEILKK